MKGIGAPRDENGGMSQIPEPASTASAPAPGPESPARRALGIGASTGIGAATVRLLRSRGWDVEEFSLNRFHGDPGPYIHLRAHETSLHFVCRLLLEKKKKKLYLEII